MKNIHLADICWIQLNPAMDCAGWELGWEPLIDARIYKFGIIGDYGIWLGMYIAGRYHVMLQF